MEKFGSGINIPDPQHYSGVNSLKKKSQQNPGSHKEGLGKK
jgi:hypothetical protein